MDGLLLLSVEPKIDAGAAAVPKILAVVVAAVPKMLAAVPKTLVEKTLELLAEGVVADSGAGVDPKILADTGDPKILDFEAVSGDPNMLEAVGAALISEAGDVALKIEEASSFGGDAGLKIVELVVSVGAAALKILEELASSVTPALKILPALADSVAVAAKIFEALTSSTTLEVAGADVAPKMLEELAVDPKMLEELAEASKILPLLAGANMLAPVCAPKIDELDEAAPVCAPKIDELVEALVSGVLAGCALEELDGELKMDTGALETSGVGVFSTAVHGVITIEGTSVLGSVDPKIELAGAAVDPKIELARAAASLFFFSLASVPNITGSSGFFVTSLLGESAFSSDSTNGAEVPTSLVLGNKPFKSTVGLVLGAIVSSARPLAAVALFFFLFVARPSSSFGTGLRVSTDFRLGPSRSSAIRRTIVSCSSNSSSDSSASTFASQRSDAFSAANAARRFNRGIWLGINGFGFSRGGGTQNTTRSPFLMISELFSTLTPVFCLFARGYKSRSGPGEDLFRLKRSMNVGAGTLLNESHSPDFFRPRNMTSRGGAINALRTTRAIFRIPSLSPPASPVSESCNVCAVIWE